MNGVSGVFGVAAWEKIVHGCWCCETGPNRPAMTANSYGCLAAAAVPTRLLLLLLTGAPLLSQA